MSLICTSASSTFVGTDSNDNYVQHLMAIERNTASMETNGDADQVIVWYNLIECNFYLKRETVSAIEIVLYCCYDSGISLIMKTYLQTTSGTKKCVLTKL